MRRPSRGVIYLLLFAGFVAIASLYYIHFPGTGAQTRSQGQLTQAVQNYHKGGADPSQTINATSQYQTVIQSDGETVDWYDNTGTKYETTVGDAGQVTRLFDD